METIAARAVHAGCCGLMEEGLKEESEGGRIFAGKNRVRNSPTYTPVLGLDAAGCQNTTSLST